MTASVRRPKGVGAEPARPPLNPPLAASKVMRGFGTLAEEIRRGRGGRRDTCTAGGRWRRQQWRSEGGAGRTGRHFTGATNLQKLYRKNSRENSDRKFHVCLRAMKTKHYSHRAPVVDTVGYDIGSH